jgi:hypothetical protein
MKHLKHSSHHWTADAIGLSSSQHLPELPAADPLLARFS